MYKLSFSTMLMATARRVAKTESLALKTSGVMRPDHPVVDGVCHLNVVCRRSEFRGFIEVDTVPFNDAVVVIDLGVLDPVSLLYGGVVEASFTVHGIVFSNNGRGPSHIGVFGFSEVIHLLGVDHVIGIVNVHTVSELVLFQFHEVGSHLARQGVFGINDFAPTAVVGQLGQPGQKTGCPYTGSFRYWSIPPSQRTWPSGYCRCT